MCRRAAVVSSAQHRDGRARRDARGEARGGLRGRLRRRRAVRAGPDRRAARTGGGTTAAGRPGTGPRALPAAARHRRAAARAVPAAGCDLVRAKFDLMQRLGARMALLCTNVSPDAIDDDDLAARAAVRGRRRGAGPRPDGRLRGAGLGNARQRVRPRVADRRARRAPGSRRLSGQLPHPGPGHQPGRDRGDSAADKLFMLQLADAPRLRMDELQWSRHYRCFPGQGAFDLESFLGRGARGRLRADRCRWRSSTTSSGRRTRSARPSTAAGPCCGWRSASAPGRRTSRTHRRRLPSARRPQRLRVHRVQRATGNRPGPGATPRRPWPAPDRPAPERSRSNCGRPATRGSW